MKKGLIIVGSLLLTGGVVFGYYYYTPKITFESIDFINQTVNYDMRVGGKKLIGATTYSKSMDNQTKIDGRYTFDINRNRSSLAGSPRESLDFVISKNGKVIAKKNVNFTTGKVTDVI